MLQNGEGGDFVVEVRQKDGQQNKVLLKAGKPIASLWAYLQYFYKFPLFHSTRQYCLWAFCPLTLCDV
jgi:hypothetical protein